MSEFIIYIIIGIVAYLLLKKKSNNIEPSKEEIEGKSKKNYEVLYNPEKTRSYQKPIVWTTNVRLNFPQGDDFDERKQKQEPVFLRLPCEGYGRIQLLGNC